MERFYRFAGVEIAVSMPDGIFRPGENFLAAFEADTAAAPHRFAFELADALDPPDGVCIAEDPGFRIYSGSDGRIRYFGSLNRSLDGAYIRTVQRDKQHSVQVKAGLTKGKIGAKTVLNAIEAEHLIARAGGFVFHCSYIDHNGRAILFTAPSETGKSTQAELWKDLRGAEIINGDRAAVRIVDGTAVAEGVPFAGSSAHCLNRSMPVAAVVYLGQAPETSIRRMRGFEAFVRIWEGVSVNTWDREDVELVSAAVKRLAETVPVFHLSCTPDESAVIALENVLESR